MPVKLENTHKEDTSQETTNINIVIQSQRKSYNKQR